VKSAITALLIGFLASPAFAGGPCYSNRCYVRPTYTYPTPNYNTHQSSVTYQYTINYAAPAAIQGQSVGGYGIPTTRDFVALYGRLDLGQAILKQQQNNADAALYASQANALTEQTIAGLGGPLARVAEIEANGNAETAKIQAATGLISQALEIVKSGRLADSLISYRAQPQQPQWPGWSPQVQPQTQGVVQTGDQWLAVSTVFQTACKECHIDKTEGNLSLADPSLLTDEQWIRIGQRLTSPDPAKRMPKTGALTFPETMVLTPFIQQAFARQTKQR